MNIKKISAILLVLCLVLTACGTGKTGDNDNVPDKNPEAPGENVADNSKAKTDPFAPYDEEITIHMVTGVNPNLSFPEGQSMEENEFLDMIKEEYNINIVYDWVSSNYTEKINMSIASNSLPDILNAGETQFRSMLKFDQLQDITETFNNTASDLLKHVVESGGKPVQDLISVDGKMMAIPAPTLTASSVTTMWIRQDWLDKLELDVPKTIDDLKKVADAFVNKDPDGNGKADTIGIVGPANSGELYGIGGTQWSLDPIFGAFKSFPKYWLEDQDGGIVYGSTTNETKEALACIAEMYKDGLIDPELFARGDSSEPTLAGKAGIFFGPSWTGYTVADSVMKEGHDWQAYAAPVAKDGKFYAHMAAPTSQYVVATKECQYPEAATKIINLLLRDEGKWIESGITDRLPTSNVYPLFNVYDNADEAEFSYDIIQKWLKDEIKMEDVDFANHKLLKGDMEAIKPLKLDPMDDFSAEYWDVDNELAPANLGRFLFLMVGMRPLIEEGYEPVYSAYYGKTETMEAKWANLEKMELETLAKIVLGQAPIESFDQFVEDWHKQGGQDIIDEITELIKK